MRREWGRLTDSPDVGLQSQAAVLLLQVLVPEQDPGRVVRLVETNGPPKVGNGLVVVSTQTVEVACRASMSHT